MTDQLPEPGTMLTLDFETFRDREFSLDRMSPLAYVLSDSFETLGAGVAFDDEEPEWIDGPDLPDFFARVPWEQTILLAHNTLFDGSVLAWRFGCRPRCYLDTLAMSRAWIGHLVTGVSLADVSAHFGFGVKMDTLTKTIGKRFAEIVAAKELHRELAEYGRSIYKALMADGFPAGQLDVIDLVVKMTVNPRLVLDRDLLRQYRDFVREEKAAVLLEAGLKDRAPLMSNAKLADLLVDAGAEVLPTKTSPRTGERIYAFAAKDLGFGELLQHDVPQVRRLAKARAVHKSTIEGSRATSLLAAAEVGWPADTPPCSLPAPLNYSGAHTHRWSGSWGWNLQNIGQESPLRKAIRAAPGERIVSCDASQIEARVLATLARQDDVLAEFREGRDVYSEFASVFFSKPVDKTTDGGRARHIGKTGILQLGFGASWASFQAQVRKNSGGKFTVDEAEARRIVELYRERNARIVAYWAECEKLLWKIADPSTKPFAFGPVTVGYRHIVLPSGLRLTYHSLRQDRGRDGRIGWFYDHGSHTGKKIYGAQVAQNLTQSLAFWHVIESGMRVKEMTRSRVLPVLQIHDEWLYVVDEEVAAPLARLLEHELGKSPSWLPDCPLAAKSAVGETYADV